MQTLSIVLNYWVHHHSIPMLWFIVDKRHPHVKQPPLALPRPNPDRHHAIRVPHHNTPATSTTYASMCPAPTDNLTHPVVQIFRIYQCNFISSQQTTSTTPSSSYTIPHDKTHTTQPINHQPTAQSRPGHDDTQ